MKLYLHRTHAWLLRSKGIWMMLLLISMSQLQAQIKIGDNPQTIHPNALLELESTTKGLLIPRMTTTQRDAAFDLSKSPAGILIFNTTIQALQLLHQEHSASGKSDHRYWATYRLNYALIGRIPENPQVGELYFDQRDNSLQIYDGNQWVPLLFQSDAQNPKLLIEAMEIINQIYAEILEDSNSPGGKSNANQKAVSVEELVLMFEDVQSTLEQAYQQAIQAHTNFSNPPTRSQVQALINQVNASN